MDLLSFATDLEAQADQLVSLIITLLTSSSVSAIIVQELITVLFLYLEEIYYACSDFI